MVNYEEWIYQVGVDPTGTLDFSNPNQVAATNLANDYISRQGASSPTNYLDFNTWDSN